MANHENSVYVVSTDNGDRYIIAHTPSQARAHVIKDFVGAARKATALEVATASSKGVRIESVPVTGGNDE